MHLEGRLYLVILENKTKASGDRFERTKGIYGVSDPTEESFGRGGYSRALIRFVLVCNVRFALIRMKRLLDRIRNTRSD